MGLIPGFDAADLINAGIYLIEGDKINAALSMAAVIPVIGGAATAGKVAGTVEKSIGKGIGFKSLNAYKRLIGKAGSGKAWHHIVEQTPSNISRFGPEMIHNTNNLIALPHGKGNIHSIISGHYSSITDYTGGLTVRKWLSSKSFEEQYQYGVKILKMFGFY